MLAIGFPIQRESDSPEPWQESPGRVVVFTLVALALSAFATATIPALVNGLYGVNRFQDDAFYYIVTANHWLTQGELAFDGRHVTNGFQPLWMAIVMAAMWVVGPLAAPEAQVLAVKILEKTALGAALGVCVWTYIGSSRVPAVWRVGFAGAILVLLCPWYVVFEQGMETTLLVFLFLCAVRALLLDSWKWLAPLSVLLFLCRLDAAVFVSGPLAAWVILRGNAPLRVRVMTALPLVIAVASLTLWNWLTTGHTVPISGAIRSSFPLIRWHGSYFSEAIKTAELYGWATFWKSLNVLLCAGVLATANILIAFGRFGAGQREKACVVSAVGWLLLLNLLLFQKWEKSVDPRYVALPMTIAAMMLLTGAQSVADRWSSASTSAASRRWKTFAPSIGLGCGLALIFATSVMEFGHFESLRTDGIQTIYKDIGSTLPSDAVLAGTDVGALAFWTRRRVINLDGVINNYEYQTWLRDGRLADYLESQGVTHIATVLWDKPEMHTGRPPEPTYRHQLDAAAVAGPSHYDCHQYYVYSYVYEKYSDQICLRASSERFRREVGKYGVAQMVYIVYELE